jgi:hypothetical protein
MTRMTTTASVQAGSAGARARSGPATFALAIPTPADPLAVAVVGGIPPYTTTSPNTAIAAKVRVPAARGRPRDQ